MSAIPSDEQLHGELNNHARLLKLKQLQRILRNLERALQILAATDAETLPSDAKLSKQAQLASIDRILESMVSVFLTETIVKAGWVAE